MNFEKFLISFQDELNSRPTDELGRAWQSRKERTEFYKRVFEKVAGRLCLEYEPELLNIDYVMREKDYQLKIIIESENETSTAEKEIWKLCCVNSPVKILLTVAEWSKDKNWSQPCRELYLKKWFEIIKNFPEEQANIKIIIAEAQDKKVEFLVCNIDKNGYSKEDKCIYSQQI